MFLKIEKNPNILELSSGNAKSLSEDLIININKISSYKIGSTGEDFIEQKDIKGETSDLFNSLYSERPTDEVKTIPQNTNYVEISVSEEGKSETIRRF